MIAALWSFLQPRLLALWKPLAAIGAILIVLMRLDWLKAKNKALKDENVDLRTKEKIVEEQAKIDKQGEADRAKVGTAGSADDFDKLWNKPK
jgi:FtsZ-binding cell division protein ZapB